MEENFCALQPAGAPLIFPGLTDARSGKRVVLSCLARETPSIDPTHPVWLVAGARLHASTAAFLSARFPVVSPTGLFTAAGEHYRFVDGGYSDNTGAGTAVEVLRLVKKAANGLGLGPRLRPVLQVLNTDDTAAPETPHLWDHGLVQLLADPLNTLDAVRAGNAKDYRRWLDASALPEADHVQVVEWRLPNDPLNPCPLGWLLSQSTQRSIADHVTASMMGDAAKKLERATGWHVQRCLKAGDAVCDEQRAKSER